MAKKSNTKAKKQARASAAAVAGTLKRGKFIFFRKPRPKSRPAKAGKLTGSFRLFMDSASLLRQHWKVFGGIVLVYLLLNVVLVGGLGGGYDINQLKQTFTEELGQVSGIFALFGLLLGSAGSAGSETGAAYQTVVVLVVSLATIWALRQILGGKKITIRDTFYRGMYPLIPFVLVLLYLGLLLIPALIGSFLYQTVFVGGLAVNMLENILWSLAVISLLALSAYWLCTRIFALYIVTLPDVRPVAAIKAARKIVLYRRWSILRKLMFLPVAMVVIGAVILLPLIAVVPAAVQWVFILLSMVGLIFAHVYIYNLYKELI